MRATTMDEKRQYLLEAMRQLPTGKWADRDDLAKQLGKNFLNPREIVALDMLVYSGLLEQRRVESSQPNVFRFEYRVKEH